MCTVPCCCSAAVWVFLDVVERTRKKKEEKNISSSPFLSPKGDAEEQRFLSDSLESLSPPDGPLTFFFHRLVPKLPPHARGPAGLPGPDQDGTRVDTTGPPGWYSERGVGVRNENGPGRTSGASTFTGARGGGGNTFFLSIQLAHQALFYPLLEKRRGPRHNRCGMCQSPQSPQKKKQKKSIRFYCNSFTANNVSSVTCHSPTNQVV